MSILFLDLASHDGLLACTDEKSVTASRKITTRIRDDELTILVQKLLEEADWSYEDLTNIACVTGPGGFTSLRVAVTFANVLTDQLKIPSAGIHLSDLLFARTPSPSPLPEGCGTGEGILWLHSTKRDSLFVRGGEWKEPTLISLSSFAAESRDSPLRGSRWTGELLPEHEAAVASLGLIPGALRNIIEILPSFLPALHYEKRPLLPWYGRDG